MIFVSGFTAAGLVTTVLTAVGLTAATFFTSVDAGGLTAVFIIVDWAGAGVGLETGLPGSTCNSLNIKNGLMPK